MMKVPSDMTAPELKSFAMTLARIISGYKVATGRATL
jgi:hypothetical protein